MLAQHTFNGRYTNAGWIGVDMFFVLSGYLITTLLIREVDLSGTIDLGRFYLRRALRLLPALAGMLLVVTVLRLLVASHPAYPGILRDAAVAGLYFSNWWVAVDQPLKGLEHTWSLAVEEQFYFLWPLSLLVLVRRLSFRAILGVVVFGAVASNLWSWHLSFVTGFHRLYYGTDSHADALLAGCAVALLARLGWRPRDGLMRRGLELGGTAALALLACASVSSPTSIRGYMIVLAISIAALLIVRWRFNSGHWAVPVAEVAVILCAALLGASVLAIHGVNIVYANGWSALAPVIAIALYGVAIVPARIVEWFLSLNALGFIGRISYGLYLWHWPIYIFLLTPTTLPEPALAVSRLAATAFAALTSYWLIERRFLRMRARVRHPQSVDQLEEAGTKTVNPT